MHLFFFFSFFKGDLLKLEVVSCHSIESSFIILFSFSFLFMFKYLEEERKSTRKRIYNANESKCNTLGGHKGLDGTM